MKRLLGVGLLTAMLVVGGASGANALPIISGSVGGAPSGVILDNLNWLALGGGGGTSGTTGIIVSFLPDAQAVQGGASGLYAPPFVSGLNGNGFGNTPGVADATTYITSGSDGGSFANAAVTILLPNPMKYFGLLWGSVDPYNTLSFYNGNTLLFSFTGTQLFAGANGDQGVNGTLYANITTDGTAFNKVVATSSAYAFEFDNLAFNPEVPTVPEPASMLLFGTGLVGLRAWKKRRG